MGKIRVIRGQARAYQLDGAVQLIQDDRRFNHGFKIRRFLVSWNLPADSGAGSRDLVAVLATHEDAVRLASLPTQIAWEWQDRRQVAWTSTNHVGDSIVENSFELIDPTHIVVRDLWFACSVQTSSGTNYFNYFVELEEVELTDNQSVLAIIQEEAQDVN
jgi:hypothetical protein